MSDQFTNVYPGQPFRFPAVVYNTLLEMAKDWQRKRLGQQGAASLSTRETRLEVVVRNDTGALLDVGHAVVLGEPLTPDAVAETPLAFRDAPVFEGEKPTNTSYRLSRSRLALAVEPIPTGKFGVVAVAGVVICDVDMRKGRHRFATPKIDEVDHLVSACRGPARILWVAGGAVADHPEIEEEIRRCVVLLDADPDRGDVMTVTEDFPVRAYHDGTLILVDASGGDIQLTMPYGELGSDDVGWSIRFRRIDEPSSTLDHPGASKSPLVYIAVTDTYSSNRGPDGVDLHVLRDNMQGAEYVWDGTAFKLTDRWGYASHRTAGMLTTGTQYIQGEKVLASGLMVLGGGTASVGESYNGVRNRLSRIRFDTEFTGGTVQVEAESTDRKVMKVGLDPIGSNAGLVIVQDLVQGPSFTFTGDVPGSATLPPGYLGLEISYKPAVYLSTYLKPAGTAQFDESSIPIPTEIVGGTTGLTAPTDPTGTATIGGILVGAHGGTGLDVTDADAGQYLVTDGAGGWELSEGPGAAPNVSAAVGILPTANGGTGADLSGATSGQVPVANGSGAFAAGPVGLSSVAGAARSYLMRRLAP